jgi:hypothetical protein
MFWKDSDFTGNSADVLYFDDVEGYIRVDWEYLK